MGNVASNELTEVKKIRELINKNTETEQKGSSADAVSSGAGDKDNELQKMIKALSENKQEIDLKELERFKKLPSGPEKFAEYKRLTSKILEGQKPTPTKEEILKHLQVEGNITEKDEFEEIINGLSSKKLVATALVPGTAPGTAPAPVQEPEAALAPRLEARPVPKPDDPYDWDRAEAARNAWSAWRAPPERKWYVEGQKLEPEEPVASEPASELVSRMRTAVMRRPGQPGGPRPGGGSQIMEAREAEEAPDALERLRRELGRN